MQFIRDIINEKTKSVDLQDRNGTRIDLEVDPATDPAGGDQQAAAADQAVDQAAVMDTSSPYILDNFLYNDEPVEPAPDVSEQVAETAGQEDDGLGGGIADETLAKDGPGDEETRDGAPGGSVFGGETEETAADETADEYEPDAPALDDGLARVPRERARMLAEKGDEDPAGQIDDLQTGAGPDVPPPEAVFVQEPQPEPESEPGPAPQTNAGPDPWQEIKAGWEEATAEETGAEEPAGIAPRESTTEEAGPFPSETPSAGLRTPLVQDQVADSSDPDQTDRARAPSSAQPTPFQRVLERHAGHAASRRPGEAAVSPAAAPPGFPAAASAKPQADVAQPAGQDTEPAVETPGEGAPQDPPTAIRVPAPAAGRAARQAGRVKTRLLGFNNAASAESDPFNTEGTPDRTGQTMFPVGWLVVISGPGRGNSFTLFNGVSQIGRGEDQSVQLDFGDNSISRTNHAAIAYDQEKQKFFLGHGGKANLVRLNDTPVLSTEVLGNGDLIRIGETTMRFIALCDSEFDWDKNHDDGVKNATFG